jgi:hypothetical protein
VVIETAKLNDLHPEANLRSVTTRIAAHPFKGIDDAIYAKQSLRRPSNSDKCALTAVCDERAEKNGNMDRAEGI